MNGGMGMNAGTQIVIELVVVVVVARVFFGKRLLWLPVKIVRGLVFLVVSSLYDRHRWR